MYSVLKNWSSMILTQKHVHVWYVFSSPDSKGHVRYCHHFASIVVLFHHLQLICLQNQPYLVKMFIGWSSLKFDFCSNGISKMSEARDLKVPKGYFLYVNVYFSTNYIVFFYVLIKFSLYIKPTDLYDLPFSRYRGVKMGPTTKILNFYLKSEFNRIFSLGFFTNFLYAVL